MNPLPEPRSAVAGHAAGAGADPICKKKVHGPRLTRSPMDPLNDPCEIAPVLAAEHIIHYFGCLIAGVIQARQPKAGLERPQQ